MRRHIPSLLSLGCMLLLFACQRVDDNQQSGLEFISAPVHGYRVVNSYPHDANAFTQGMLFNDGYLYESTGLHGRSSVRRVDINTGRVLRRVDLPPRYFGEGLAVYDGRLYQLTWKSETGFIYDIHTLALTGSFNYEGEGWGLAFDGRHFIMSNGSNKLGFFDPDNFKKIGILKVHDNNRPVSDLNELAVIGNEIWANVFPTDWIARIDPSTGKVTGWIDLSGILTEDDRGGRPVDVLNGIAYDEGDNRIFVTGKLWPRLYEIEVAAP